MKKHTHLNAVQRRVIGQLRKEVKSLRYIASLLDICASTISRELRRNRTGFGYISQEAQRIALQRRSCASRRPPKVTEAFRSRICDKLAEGLSPEQIAPTFNAAGSLHRLLRRKGKPYRPARSRYRIPDRVPFNERPLSVQNKRFYRDWELDLMHRHDTPTYVLVAVQRKSLFVCLAFLPHKQAHSLSECLIPMLMPFKVRTLTRDNGMEFSQHRTLAQALDAKTYFCHAYCAWQKGLVENTIGLLRQYYPKHCPYNYKDTGLRGKDFYFFFPLRTSGALGFILIISYVFAVIYARGLIPSCDVIWY